MNHTEKPDEKTTKTEVSKVSERLAWLKDRPIRVKIKVREADPTEEFVCVYKDCLPTGSAYFFLVEIDGKRRLIATNGVLEIIEL